jgi:serine/threonine-protein kinase
VPAVDPLRPLLDAAVASDLDLAPVETVARALGRVWLDEGAEAQDLAARLPVAADAREALRAEAERRLAACEGNVRRALLAMGGPSPTLRRRLLDVAPGLSRAVTDVAQANGPPLRRVAPGRYVDFTPVGEGGMGVVYWALDTELSRQVAFKIVRPPEGDGREGITPSVPLALDAPDADSPEASSFEGLRMRFLQEAWVTGGMEHPGIVPVYELGETDRGVPYYTMRFVRGSRTLDTAIRELADASPEERIERLLEPFLKVCDTVRYAHSRGVIHRDLKCANVALGDYGEVVLLDWGLARVRGGLDGGEDPWAARATSLREERGLRTVASAVGTPGYMSPEAARGESDALDERSDVYTLGVLLFRILTGRLPFPVENTVGYVEQVLTGPPPHPVDLAPSAPAGLAEVCRRALAADPAGRPQSADEFAEAVRAWRAAAAREREVALLLAEARGALENASAVRGAERLRDLDRASATGRRILDLEPAHPAARALLADVDRMRETGIQERERHARRRVLQRAGAAALAVAVVAGGVVAWLLETRRQEAEGARVEARSAQSRAEDVMSFMVYELQSSLEPIGRLDVLAKIGATAQRYYASLPPDGRSPEVLIGHSVALRRLGDVYEARGDLPAALEAFRLAGEVAARVLEAAPQDTVGRYQRSLAEARVGRVLFGQGYASDAKRVFLEHRRDVERLLAERPDDPEIRDALASAHAAIGTVLRAEGSLEAAGEASREALALGRAIEAHRPGEDEWRRRRIGRQLDLAHQCWITGELASGRREARDALAECLAAVNEPARAGDVRWLELAAQARYALILLQPLGDPERVALATDSLEAFRALLARDPSNDRWRRRVAQSLVHLGDACRRQGDVSRALELAQEAYRVGLALTEKDPTNASWLNFLITTCDRMAYHSQAVKADRSAIAAYRDLAVEHARHLVALDPGSAKWRHILAFTLTHHARALAPDRADDARRHLEEALVLVTAMIGDGPAGPELAVLHAVTRQDLVTLERAAGRGAAALDHLRRAADVLERSWRHRQDLTDVLGALRTTSTELISCLARGDAADRDEARRRVESLLATSEAERQAGDPERRRHGAGWQDALEALRRDLAATAEDAE